MEENRCMDIGLVLEGGGAKGAYQVGAWKALRELGYNIKGVVGTSVGALNGALIAQEAFDHACNVWQNITYSHVIDVDDELFTKLRSMNIAHDDVKTIFNSFKKIIKNNGFDIEPMKKMMHELVDEAVIRQSGIDFGLVTFSVSDFKPIEIFIDEIEEGLLEDYLLASAYLPVFKTEKLHGKYYVDGGIYNNLPIKMLVDRDYHDIFVIRIHGTGVIQRYLVPEDVSVTYIEPRESLGGVLDFETDSARYNFNLGYYDALRVIRKLKGRRYYIQAEMEESEYIRQFLNMPKRVIDWSIRRFGDEELNIERNLFERVLPRFAKKLGLPDSWTYEELYIAIYEYVAELMKVDRFQCFTLETFKGVIKDSSITEKEYTLIERIVDGRFSKALVYLCKHW